METIKTVITRAEKECNSKKQDGKINTTAEAKKFKEISIINMKQAEAEIKELKRKSLKVESIINSTPWEADLCVNHGGAMIGAAAGCGLGFLAGEAVSSFLIGTAIGGPVGAGLSILAGLGTFALSTYTGQKIGEKLGLNQERQTQNNIQDKIESLQRDLNNYKNAYNNIMQNINFNG